LNPAVHAFFFFLGTPIFTRAHVCIYLFNLHENCQIFFGVVLYDFRNIEITWCLIGRLWLAVNISVLQQTKLVYFVLQPSYGFSVFSLRRMIKVSWTPPPPHDHYYKVNADMSHKKSSEISTYGGLIRNSYDKFICGFYNQLDSWYAIWTELWTLHIEIEMANQLNTKKVSFEVN